MTENGSTATTLHIDREQLRVQIVKAMAEALGLDWTDEDTVDQAEAFEVVDKAVMPTVDELLARARYMREAAALLSRNLGSAVVDLDAASSTNETLLKLVRARDAQVAELTAAVAEKEAERARLRKLYSDAVREINLLNDALEQADDEDDEVFCVRCAAGVDSSEHHAECAVTGHALDGESAPRAVDAAAAALTRLPPIYAVTKEDRRTKRQILAVLPCDLWAECVIHGPHPMFLLHGLVDFVERTDSNWVCGSQVTPLLTEPNACRACGIPQRTHATRVMLPEFGGMHTWVEPSDEQRKTRMLTRRAIALGGTR